MWVPHIKSNILKFEDKILISNITFEKKLSQSGDANQTYL